MKEYIFGRAEECMRLASPDDPVSVAEVMFLENDVNKLALIVAYIDETVEEFPLTERAMDAMIYYADQRRVPFIIVMLDSKKFVFKVKPLNLWADFLLPPGTVLSEKQLALWICALRNKELDSSELKIFDEGTDELRAYQEADRQFKWEIHELIGTEEDIYERSLIPSKL